jgi:hypothetical protein
MQELLETPEEIQSKDQLFTVWFDVACNRNKPDWWWESPRCQSLSSALKLASKLRTSGWTCNVWPEGINPREDGRWDNP